MSDLTSIQGKALLDRKVIIKLLSMLEPNELDSTSGVYDIGYERCKADLMKVMATALGPEFAASPAMRLVKELRRESS